MIHIGNGQEGFISFFRSDMTKNESQFGSVHLGQHVFKIALGVPTKQASYRVNM